MQYGYDSTWSEVEHILDDFRRCRNWPIKKEQEKLICYNKIQEGFGVIGVVVVHNMLQDTKIDEKMVHDGKEMKKCLLAYDQDKVRQSLYILLSNVLICVGALRENHGIRKEYWMLTQKEFQKQKALSCLKSIICYFPKIKKMKRFLKKYDAILAKDFKKPIFSDPKWINLMK